MLILFSCQPSYQTCSEYSETRSFQKSKVKRVWHSGIRVTWTWRVAYICVGYSQSSVLLGVTIPRMLVRRVHNILTGVIYALHLHGQLSLSVCRLRLRLRLAATQRPSTSARSAPVTLTLSPPSAPTAHPPLWRSSAPPRPPSSRPPFPLHTRRGVPGGPCLFYGVPSPSGGYRETFLSF